MFSQTSRYALRILGYLATNRDRWVLAREIAGETGIPANYLSKILSQLRKRGFVESLKGWGGGFRLKGTAGGVSISAQSDEAALWKNRPMSLSTGTPTA